MNGGLGRNKAKTHYVGDKLPGKDNSNLATTADAANTFVREGRERGENDRLITG